jgi:hypothetical protein
MATRMIAVRSVRDGAIFQLDHDSRCVPLPIECDGRTVEILSVERGFEDLACVCYEFGDGIGGYVTSEVPLSECSPGNLVVVSLRARPAASSWMVVQIGTGVTQAAFQG